MHENVIAIAIFIVVIASVALDKIHKATIAILGMVMLFITRIFTVQEAIEHVDFNTIGVLLGMMLFVGVVKQSGLFEYIAIKTCRWKSRKNTGVFYSHHGFLIRILG